MKPGIFCLVVGSILVSGRLAAGAESSAVIATSATASPVVTAVPAPVATLRVVSATAAPFVFGNYRLVVLAEGDLSNAAVIQELKQASRWSLKEVGTETSLPLPAPELAVKAGRFMASFVNLDLSFKSHYRISFNSDEFQDISIPPVAGMDLAVFEKEKGKSGAWVTSMNPRFVQVSSTAGTALQPGVDAAASMSLHDTLAFDLKASLGLNKDDPGNYEAMSVDWQPWTYSLSQNGFIGTDFLGIKIQETASQSLVLHDLSGGLRSSMAIHPFNGIQPLYLTGGLDAALRHLAPGKNYSDPRTYVEARWGWEGMVGAGSHLLVIWQYWTRMDQWAPASDPVEPTEREYVQVEATVPWSKDKNIKITYSDGQMPPTFVAQTMVKAGLEVFWDGKSVYSSDKVQ